MNTFKSEFVHLPEFFKLIERIREQSLRFFGQPQNVTLKADQSPLTATDQLNHETLTEALPKLFAAPVFSEELYPEFSARQGVSEYWLIDPIDGTKEFVHCVPDFSVLISLVRAGRPRFAAIHIPTEGKTFFAEEGRGAFLESGGHFNPITPSAPPARRGLLSRFHPEPEVEAFYQERGINDSLRVGSALKFCALVTGQASHYFRKSGPREWDVAAGDLLVQEAGGQMFTWPEKSSIQYGREQTRVAPFLAVAPQVVWK